MLKLKKIISLIVSLCLLISLFFDAVYASKNYNHNASQSFEILDNFRIINSSYKPGTPLIIFINELHSDPQVQQLIYKTLERLYSDGILSQVFTEGAPAEKIDISSLLQPDYEKRKKIIDSLLLSGLVSGAEVFAVNKGFKDIYGIEDWNIYLENLKIAAGIYNSNNSFFDIKENLYDNFSKEMRDTVKKISELHNLNESGLSKDNSYSTVVQNYDEIDKYLKIAGLKKRLDEKAAQKDIYSVFEFLKSNIPYKEFIYITDKYSKSGSEEFLSEFFELLKKRFNNVLADHSALTELLYLNELKYASNPKTLIYQTSLLKNNIIENISLSSDRELAALYFFFELLDKYASLAVSEEEFNDLLRNRNLILKTVFKYFPEKDYAKVAKLLSDNNLLRYYENNIKRNLIFYENIKKNIANMKADNKAVFGGKTYSSVNVTIMGGFHKNTANLFNEDEISFISLIPVMKESQKNVYKDIIRLSSSALAPPLLSAGVENNEINALIDFWSSFGNIYSKQAVQSVNGWFSEKNIAFRVSIGKEHQIIFKKIEPDKKISFKDTVKRFFKKLFSRKKAVVKEDLTKEEIIAGEYLKTLRSLNGKMPDIILVSLKNKEDIQFYKSIIENMPHLANTNIKFITTSDNGTGSSFITISEYVNSIKTGNEFQNLKDKKWQDLKICAINIDGLSKEVTGKEIPFEFNGRRITPFELSLLNGIRACQSFGRRQGGLALMSPENIYVGNMISEGEITVITSMESYGDILNYEMPWIISEQGDIKKMYYMFDSEKIKDKLEKKGILDRMDNLENRDFRQFETTTGNILFSFKDDLLYSSFFERISQLYKHIYTNSSSGIDPPSIDFIQHILIPILRMKNGEDSLSYFTKMGIDDVFGEFYDRYSSFFDSSINKEFQKIIENLSLKTYTQPYSYYASANNPVLPEGIYRQNLINRIDYGDISDNFFVHSVESAYKELFLEVSNSRLQKKYYSLERKDSVSLYKNIAEKSSYDIKRINNYFENHSEIDFNDRKILENLRNLFVSLEYYALEYIRTLDSFENISVLGGYIFPKTSLFERLKIMPFNRFIFGMHRNFQREKEKLRRQAYKLYVLGNNINDSMYDYNALLSDIEEYIKEKEFPGEKTSLGIEKSWSTRKAIHRILSLFLAVSNTLPAVITASSTSSISKIIYSVFTGIGLSIFLHRFMIFIGKRNSFYNAKIKDLFSSGGEYFENLYLNLKIDNDFHFENTGNREELPDIIKRSMEESAAAYLIKWKNVLDSKDFDANNMEIIRKYALQLIRITFFSQDSFNSNNKEQIISIIQDFIKLHKLSMKKIKQMPDDEKEKYELEIKNFEEAGKYAQSYYNVLSYALNADILNGYRVSKGMFFFFLEKTGVLKIVRSIMGINAGIYFSQKGFINSVRNIIYHGNRLIPGLYDEKNLMFFSEKYMESKKRPERFNIGISEHWKVRKMLARTLPLVIFALNIVIHPILFNTPFNMVSSLVTGVGLSVAMHWIPIIPVIYSWFKDIIRDRKLVKELKRNDIESFRNRIIKSKAGDLFGKIPFGKMPDIIFISADLPEDKMSYIKTFISGVKNKGNMKNLTVKYIAKNDIGDGNAVI
ncbi:MAG: hypothetical protein FWF00_07405 [Endomicrobia bacterium]|nr:hypothetical protein [Endomicrobiia bacterium]